MMISHKRFRQSSTVGIVAACLLVFIFQLDAALGAVTPGGDLTSVKPVQAFTQESGPSQRRKFSLRICSDLADKNNKEIALAASNLPIAAADIIIAKAVPNPTYNMSYGFGPAWAYIIAGNNQIFGWNEEIQVAGKRTKKTDLARANYAETALQIEIVRFNVHNRVRRAYGELVVAAAYAKLVDNQESVAKKLFDIAQKRYAADKAPGAEVLQAKLNLLQFEPLRNQARGRLIHDSAQLAYLIGETPHDQEIIDIDAFELNQLLSGKSNVAPDPDKGLPPLMELLPTAWQERNDLKAAVQQAFADQKALTLAKSQRIPDPFVGFSYLFSTYKPYQLQYFTPVSDAHKVPYQPGYLLTVASETPIFYQHQGEVSQAKATWIQQLKQNDQLRSKSAADIVMAYEALATTVKNLGVFKNDLLPAAMKAAQLSHRSYELGQSDLASAILAQQQFGQLASAYFDAAISYQNNWADLEQAVGVPLRM